MQVSYPVLCVCRLHAGTNRLLLDYLSDEVGCEAQLQLYRFSPGRLQSCSKAKCKQLDRPLKAAMHNKCLEALRLQYTGVPPLDAPATDRLQDWQSTQHCTPSDMLEDSCWTDLPDLDLNNSVDLQSDVFARDASQASSPNIQSLSMFRLNEADLLLPEQFDSALFPDSMADMDLESLLPHPNCTPRLTSDRQLQPKTPLVSNNHFDDFLQQLYPSGACPPASRDTEQQGSQSQESAAEVQAALCTLSGAHQSNQCSERGMFLARSHCIARPCSVPVLASFHTECFIGLCWLSRT